MRKVRMQLLLPVLSALGLAVGCTTVGELSEPTDIAPLVSGYRIAGLDSKTGDLATVLDLSACVEQAALVSIGLSGVPSVAGYFPVRSLMAREFDKVVVGNFRTVLPDEEPRLELRIESKRLDVRRSWSKVSAEMTFEISLMDPRPGLRPYFRKEYRMTSQSTEKDKTRVPACVYSCVQHLAREFLEDVSQNTLTVERLHSLCGNE